MNENIFKVVFAVKFLSNTMFLANKFVRTTPAALVQIGSRTMAKYNKVLNSLSKNVVNAEYAVRGQIPQRGEQLTKMLKDESGQTQYMFENTTALNIGNP